MITTMKLQFNSLIKCAAALFCGASLFACTELSELEERVDSLDSRITALETQIPALQGNIDAVQAMFNEQIFITSITTNDAGDEYTLTMSDGKNYTIKQGKIGNTPQIAVDENNYWIVSYDSGATFSRIKGTDGKELTVKAAPQFRVDSDGNWEISADGTNWTDAADPDGNPVKAVGEGGDFFQDIAYDDESGKLTLTLGDGKEYTFTVTTDFVCQIINDLNPVEFSPGQTKEFDVKLRGVQSIYITRPEGWAVKLEGDEATDPAAEIVAKLTVTAPAAAGIQTKVSADTDRDIVLHATAASSERSIFAKMSVAVKVDTAPSVTIEAAEISDVSIIYTVEKNSLATSWKYIHQLSSDEAPAAESANWTDGPADGRLEIKDLETETAYTLYVLPVGAEGNGAIVKYGVITKETPITDYYTYFMAGNDIEIGGKIYNKNQFTEEGQIQILKETGKAIYDNSSSYGNGKIIFIDIENQVDPVSIGNAGDIIVIGNNPENKTRVIRSATYLQDAGKKRLVLANLIIDIPNGKDNKGEAVTDGFVAGSAFSELTLDNCDILMNNTKPLIAITTDNKSISNINIVNCKIRMPSGNSNRYIISTAKINNTIESLNFKNNVVYCDDGMATTFRLVNSSNDQTQTTINNIVFESNTLSNICYNNSAMVIALDINQATVTKNLVYFDTDSWSGITQQYHCALRAYGNYPATANCVDNIVYYDQTVPTGVEKGGRYYFRIFQKSDFKPTTGSSEEFELISTDPFASGDIATFTPSSSYSSYGSTIGR